MNNPDWPEWQEQPKSPEYGQTIWVGAMGNQEQGSTQVNPDTQNQNPMGGTVYFTPDNIPGAPDANGSGTINLYNLDTNSILNRVDRFLENGNWAEADSYCNYALSREPQNANIYLRKLMAELQVHTPAELVNCPEPFDYSANYANAILFGGEKLAATLDGYNTYIRQRNAYETSLHSDAADQDAPWKDEVYNYAVSQMSLGTPQGYGAAASSFRSIPGWRDADALLNTCEKECKNEARIPFVSYVNNNDLKNADADPDAPWKDEVYNYAVSQMSPGTKQGYETAVKSFRTIPGWRDADALLNTCLEELNKFPPVGPPINPPGPKNPKKLIILISSIAAGVILLGAAAAVTVSIIKKNADKGYTPISTTAASNSAGTKAPTNTVKPNGNDNTVGEVSVSEHGKITVPSVTGLELGGRTEDAIRLNWKPVKECEGYTIEQFDGGNWKAITKIDDKAEKTYKVENLEPSTEYTFRVTTFAKDGDEVVYGEPVSLTDKTRPSEVAGLVCGGRAVDAIRLNWTKNSTGEGYIIERKLEDGSWKRVLKLKDASEETVKLDGLQAGTAYKYRICAYTMYGTEGVYGAYSYLDASTKPAAVKDLTIGGTSTTAIRLNWTSSKNALGYIIEQQKADGTWEAVATISKASEKTYKIDGLESGKSYTFRMCTYLKDGDQEICSAYEKISATTK